MGIIVGGKDARSNAKIPEGVTGVYLYYISLAGGGLNSQSDTLLLKIESKINNEVPS